MRATTHLRQKILKMGINILFRSYAMKNESLQYPFPTLDDKRFDLNKDGKLDTFETIFRDAHLNEMNRKAEQYAKEKQSKPKDSFEPINQNKKTSDTNVSDGLQLLAIFLAIVVLIGGIVLAIAVDTSLIGRALICFAAVGIALLIFKAVGL